MNRIVYVLPLSGVAAFGFYLNSDYYQLYFADAGYPGTLPLLMALFFISSELVLWSFANRENPISILLKYGLVVFSIFATLSSQFTSTSLKESASAKIVYEKIDNSAEINWYKEQIEIQNGIINDINKMRAEKLVFTLSEDSMIKAENKRDEYEKKLDELKSENKEEIAEVYQVDNIYFWFASELPRIIKSGLNEELIRVLFQLFSSILLAAMAPVCISILRGYKAPIKDEPEELSDPVSTESEEREVLEVVDIQFPEYKPKKEEMSKSDKSNILKMLLYYYSEKKKEVMPPEEAAQFFLNLHKEKESVKAYSLAECKKIYDMIIEKNLIGKDKEIIREEIVNA